MKKTTLLILILIIFILIVGCNKNSQYVDAGIDNINNQDNKNVDTSNQPNYEVVEKTNNNANNVAEEDGFESVTGMAVIDSVETNEEAYLDDGINVIDNKPILDPRIQKFIDNARKVIKYSYKARYPESYGRRHVLLNNGCSLSIQLTDIFFNNYCFSKIRAWIYKFINYFLRI